jgi:hypothetical protein
MKDAVLDFFGIGSPSRLMAGYGRDIGAGLALGIRDSIPVVTDAATRMAQEAADRLNLSPAVQLAIGTSVGTALTTPITPAGGEGASAPTDPSAIAEGVARGLEGIEVVLSETAVTNGVNRRNRLDRRR